MFTLNDDLSIYVTRGDIVFFEVSAIDDDVPYSFKPGDIVRFKVFGKKDAENVVLQKDFPVVDLTQIVQIYLDKEDTKIGEVISKPKDYWYEVELNPDTAPQTIIGYDEDGAKVFKLYPEGDDIPPYVPDIKPEDIPIVDEELDLTSARPIQNKAVATAVAKLSAEFKAQTGELIANIHNSDGFIQKIVDVCKTYTDNFDKLVYGNNHTAYDSVTKPVDGLWQLDCSSFQNLLIRGVTFENSRYGGGDNKENPLFFNKFDPYEFRVANAMAKWLYDNGYTFAPNADFSNIEPGDLVFYSWPETTGEFHENAFMHIDHVAMFLQKKNDSKYQTIQYERYTPNFFYDVNEEYMSDAVLVARLPFPMVESPNENIVADSHKISAIIGSTKFIVSEQNLEKPMIPGKMYTCCFKGRTQTEGSYFVLKSHNDITLYSNYGEAWSGEEKEYKFSFICPTGLDDYNKIYISCSAGTETTRTASVKNFCMYEGYKRAYDDRAISAPYPLYRDFEFTDSTISDMNSDMLPGGYILEFRDYYLVYINCPLKTLRSGNVHIGYLGKQVSETRRIPANLVAVVDGVIQHYNGFLQVSGSSPTGDVYVSTWNSSQKYQYIMANGVIAK